MTNENICECGHEEYKHQLQGCIDYGEDYCPCKKFKEVMTGLSLEYSNKDDKSYKAKDKTAENNQSQGRIKVQEKSMVFPDALRGLKIGGKVMPKEFFNPKFIQEKGIFDTTDLEKEIEGYFRNRTWGHENINLKHNVLDDVKKIIKQERQRLKAEVEKIFDDLINSQGDFISDKIIREEMEKFRNAKTKRGKDVFLEEAFDMIEKDMLLKWKKEFIEELKKRLGLGK